MKIVFLSDDFPPTSFGGAGISTYDLALGMKKAGHDVFVITTCRNKSEAGRRHAKAGSGLAEAGESEYNGLKLFKIASDYPGKWRWYVSLYNPPVVRQVKEILKKIKPDVVHVNNVHFYLSYHCLKLAKLYSKIVVFTARDVMSFNFAKLTTKRYLENFDYRTTWRDHLAQARKRWNPFRNLIIRNYLKYADKLFAVSDALRQALEQNGIKGANVIHTGIDVTEWQVPRHHLENKKVILFGGRMSESKGGKQAREAFEYVVKEVPNAVLKVVGGAEWLGRDEMKIAYAQADIVLVPSICFDSFPRTVLEAMAAGRPVVGTCYGGTPEIIVDGVTGYIVNPFKTREMAEKIIDLLKNPEKAETFGRAGRDRVRIEFSLADVVKKYESFYADKRFLTDPLERSSV